MKDESFLSSRWRKSPSSFISIKVLTFVRTKMKIWLKSKICSTYLFLGALFAPTFYYWKSTCVKVIKSKLNTALWVICLLYSIHLLFCYILKCCYLVRWTLLRFYSFARSGDFTWVRFFLVVARFAHPNFIHEHISVVWCCLLSSLLISAAIHHRCCAWHINDIIVNSHSAFGIAYLQRRKTGQIEYNGGQTGWASILHSLVSTSSNHMAPPFHRALGESFV
jgi:hypothetical protein